MTNQPNPEQTPDMSGPTEEEEGVEAAARAMAIDAGCFVADKKRPKFDWDAWWLSTGAPVYRKQARAAIRALDEVRRK